MHFSELGDRWAPTILETKQERDFIRQSQKGLKDTEDYFIAGHNSYSARGSFRLSSYDIWQEGNMLRITANSPGQIDGQRF